MKTFNCDILVEADADTVGQMLERLAAFAKELDDAEHIRVVGYQWNEEKGAEVKTLDIRKPAWTNYVKKGGKP